MSPCRPRHSLLRGKRKVAFSRRPDQHVVELGAVAGATEGVKRATARDRPRKYDVEGIGPARAVLPPGKPLPPRQPPPPRKTSPRWIFQVNQPPAPPRGPPRPALGRTPPARRTRCEGGVH